MQELGRIEIFTNESTITYENVIDVLRKALPEHTINALRIDFLDKYEKGKQPIQRIKTYRPDINCQCVDNIANEVTEFQTGFKWGNPITLVQRGENLDATDGVLMLNEQYELQSIKAKTQKLARFVEIGSLGYTFVDINTDWEEGESFFEIESLDPRYTFVIKSSYYFDHRPMLGITYRIDEHGNKYFTCFTQNTRYEILNANEIINGAIVDGDTSWLHQARSGEVNPLGRIPIIEWIRSYDRMGCFERQIPEMDNLNLLISDFTNDVEQNTQAVWHANDVEFPTETIENEDGTKTESVRKPKNNEWLNTYTTQDGKTPFVNPLSINYDYEGMLNNIITRRSLILQKCNVPQRNDNSGGSTGVAMSDATGWSAAETAASRQQNIMEACKMEEVKVVLRALQISPDIPQDSPLLKLKVSDIQPNIKRQKTYELTVKTNSLTNLIGHGFSLEDSLTIAPLFEDPNQVLVRSGEGVRRYQEANVFNTSQTSSTNTESKPFGDYSDQEENSPNIGGMEMNNQQNSD